MRFFLPFSFSHDPFGVYAINFKNSKGGWAVDVPWYGTRHNEKSKKGGAPTPLVLAAALRSLKLMLGGGG